MQFEEISAFLLHNAGEDFTLRTVLRILDAEELIAQHPHAGQLEPWLQDKGLEHRRVVIGNYKLIYRIEGDMIWIADLFETHQDPNSMKR